MQLSFIIPIRRPYLLVRDFSNKLQASHLFHDPFSFFKKELINVIHVILFSFFLTGPLLAQSILDQLDDDSAVESNNSTVDTSNLITETIQKISASKQVLILSNNSSSFGKGDFISLILDNKLINRAIVAKTVSGAAGIKIVKVYNSKINQFLKPGLKVQVLHGDDSYFLNEKKIKKTIIKLLDSSKMKKVSLTNQLF